MNKLYDIHGNEIIISAGEPTVEADDTLLGTLPYKIEENGCYILSKTNATISTGEGSEQLLDFTNNVTFSLSLAAYNHATYEVRGKNEIDISFEDIDGNVVVYFDTTNVGAGKTYTLFAKTETEVTYQKTPYVRLLGNTVQCNMNTMGVFAYKTFTTTDATLANGSTKSSIQIPRDTVNTRIGDTFTVTLYLFEGELTELPTSVEFDIVANTKYFTDGYIGCTLDAVNGEDVKVYRSDSGVDATDSGGVIFFGDSILDYSDVIERYAKKTGKSVLDCSIGGTRMSASRDSSNAYYPVDMVNIADAIVSGDFSAQLASGVATAGLTVLATANIANYKAMVLEFGTNDFTAKASFNGEDATSIEGALKHILSAILTKYPNMRIVVLSTMQYVTVGSGDESGVPTHTDGTVWEMNEVIKNVCESPEYNVPFVDMYHAMGQNGVTRNILTSDGVHLMNPAGCKRYADILTAKLNGLGI